MELRELLQSFSALGHLSLQAELSQAVPSPAPISVPHIRVLVPLIGYKPTLVANMYIYIFVNDVICKETFGVYLQIRGQR